MKRKLIVAAGMVVAVVGVVTGTALCLSRCLSVSFECRVDFLYEFRGAEHSMLTRAIVTPDMRVS